MGEKRRRPNGHIGGREERGYVFISDSATHAAFEPAYIPPFGCSSCLFVLTPFFWDARIHHRDHIHLLNRSYHLYPCLPIFPRIDIPALPPTPPHTRQTDLTSRPNGVERGEGVERA